MDRRPSSASTTLASWTVAVWEALVRAARAAIMIDEEKAYRPEAYYMRGPGPKWREKHAQARGSSQR
jgi:hypothetical protein